MRKTLKALVPFAVALCMVGLTTPASAMKGASSHETLMFNTSSAGSPVCASTTLTTSVAVVVTVTNQPSSPRNIRLIMTDANASVTALDITVVGTNQYGEVVRQEIRMTSAASTVAARNLGNIAFAAISSITINAGTTGYGAGVDVMQLLYGEKLGFVTPVFATTDVVVVTTATAFAAPVAATSSNYTVNVPYGTLLLTSISITEQVDVWVRPSKEQPARQQRMKLNHTSNY